MRKLTLDEFLAKALEQHGDRYEYSEVIYVSGTTNIRIICKEHGSFWQSPNSHLQGHGCITCGGTKQRTTAEFIDKAKEVHGDTYDYSMVAYKNKSDKVAIICSTHGIFMQIPHGHLRGSGCPECARDISAKARSTGTDAFIIKALLAHGDTYSYTKVEYKNSNTKIVITCNVHGDFLQTPSNHLKYGCKQCALSINSISERCGKSNGKITTLYYIYFPEYNLWKIGCTSRSLSARFQYDKLKYTILFTKDYMDSSKAFLVEQWLLNYTKNNSTNIKILKGGNSELRTFPVVDIEDLVILAEDEVIYV